MDLITSEEKKIINRIQSDFPVDERPFSVIAHETGLTEERVIEIVSDLKKRGIIRRIGGNFGPDKLGFFSTLCAAKVPVEEIENFAGVVNSYDGVTHNYVRENEFNVWFTFIASETEIIENALKEIALRTGIKDIYNFPATHIFKISAKFKL
jgi:DNA-binding Lrp family transcriptional regulator